LAGSRAFRVINLVGNGAVIVLLTMAGFVLLRPAGPVGGFAKRLLARRAVARLVAAQWASITAAGIRLDAHPVSPTVVYFGDYECGPCRREHAVVRALVEADSQVGIVYLHATPSSRLVHSPAHASVCAGRQDRFLQMHNHLYGSDTWFKVADWTREARLSDISDIAAFLTCFENDSIPQELRTQRRWADRLGIFGTPSFLLRDGRILVGSVPLDSLERFVKSVSRS
jgi:protein-disulfide isomerase